MLPNGEGANGGSDYLTMMWAFGSGAEHPRREATDGHLKCRGKARKYLWLWGLHFVDGLLMEEVRLGLPDMRKTLERLPSGGFQVEWL